MGRTRTPRTSRSSRPRKATSTPRTSRSKYPLILRALCDNDAATRLPYDHWTLHSHRCFKCHNIGEQFDRTVYLRGRAGWHIRVCRKCSFHYYPPQPPPTDKFVQMIEAKRDELQADHAEASPLAHSNSASGENMFSAMSAAGSTVFSPVPSPATPSLVEASSSASSSRTKSRSGQTPADIARDEQAARELQRKINMCVGEDDWTEDMFYNVVNSPTKTALDIARDAALARSLQEQDAIPKILLTLRQSPTIFQTNEGRERISQVTKTSQRFMGVAPSAPTTLSKRTRRGHAKGKANAKGKGNSKGKAHLPKTPSTPAQRTPQPFP
ncbi:hypothetical protein K466DRAFT_571093, partial [Polyporus arcularius HHB13444]